MPRDGSGVYTQPFPDVVAGTTIESAKYNGNVNDVEQDLNAPRPIVAGGTGASSVDAAVVNLGVVTGKAVMTYTDAEKTQARANIAAAPSTYADEAEKAAARVKIYAAPLDALAYNGMQINGSMEVSQELGTTGASLVNGAPNKYIVDGWTAAFGNSSAVFGAFPTDLLATPVPADGWLTTALSLRSPTRITTLAAGDYAQLMHPIEGYRVSRLGWGTTHAQPITVAFWVRATVSGSATLAAYNAAANRSHTVAFTVTSPLTWEYKTITIPGDTNTSAVWGKTNSTGVTLSWGFAVGSTYRGAEGAWTAGFFIGTLAQTNFYTADANIVSITGVVVLPGIEAPSAERSALIMRPFDQELLTCQRYWYRSNTHWQGKAGATVKYVHTFPVSMRAVPTATFTGSTWGLAGFSSTTVSETTTDFTTPTFLATTGADGYVNGTIIADARL